MRIWLGLEGADVFGSMVGGGRCGFIVRISYLFILHSDCVVCMVYLHIAFFDFSWRYWRCPVGTDLAVLEWKKIPWGQSLASRRNISHIAKHFKCFFVGD